MRETNTGIAGIDTSKEFLDLAVHGCTERWRVANSASGFKELLQLLRKHRVGRVGIEATGGYERDVVEFLRKAKLTVVVLQPLQVRAFAQFTLCRAKSDKIDAGLVAACTAWRDSVREPPDARLAPLADLLTYVEQIEEDIARHKVRLEHVRDKTVGRLMQCEIAKLKDRRAKMIAKILAALRRHEDLATRFDLVMTIDGIGARTALALIIRMPELGRLTREQAASLAGLAPFVHDSGKLKGERHIAAGRGRVRKSIYAATIPAAFRWNAHLVAFYARLIKAGKPPKVALVACARKLLIYANAVLARGTPWTETPAKA